MGRSTAIAKRAGTHALLRTFLQVVGAAGLVTVVALSAIVTKQVRSRSELPALAQLDGTFAPGGSPSESPDSLVQPDSILSESEPSLVIQDPLVVPDEEPEIDASVVRVPDGDPSQPQIESFPADTRWFNGRPVRPSRTITMTVTAYTPDEISCGSSADGITASLHSVWTNAMRLVAADSKVLPLGSMVTVPGYADDSIVPVLDRGGKIKGNRLDVLYADNTTARKWGRQKLTVTVWTYADGKPAEDWRAIRDSRK